MNELGYWDKAVFITLTFDDLHLPADHSLHKDTLQKFFKRLRKNYGKPLRYYACGEYGEKVKTLYDSHGQGQALGRPHYHAIVFGLGNDKESKECVKNSWRFCDWSQFQDKKVFGSVTFDSCRYVTDYIFKKFDKVKALDVYGDRQPPFKIGSNGLGLSFVMDNAEQLKHNGFTSFRGVKVSLPRYYRLKLGIKDTWSDRYNRSMKKTYAILSYMKRHKIPISEQSYVWKRSLEQRAIDMERNAELHRKGDL